MPHSLLVLARGLWLDRILTNLLRLYCDPASLVLVLNWRREDYNHVSHSLQFEQVMMCEVQHRGAVVSFVVAAPATHCHG